MVLAASLAALVAGVVIACGATTGTLGAPIVTHTGPASTGNSNRKGKTVTDGWQTDAKGKPPA
jgi:hypothetical protein